MTGFQKKLEQKVSMQLSSQRVGYLLGAGSSYLNGNGYPLMTNLWSLINEGIPVNEREDIQAKLDEGVDGLEAALDLLDDGGIHVMTQQCSNTVLELCVALGKEGNLV